jgi:hypothetical protein
MWHKTEILEKKNSQGEPHDRSNVCLGKVFQMVIAEN